MTRVALVEDNADNRLLVEAILAPHLVLDQYADGTSALAGMATMPPDVVLLDISLPDLDGRDVLRRLRGLQGLAETPVLALTAHAMAGDRERFLAAGFTDHVTKPILDPDALLSAVRAHAGAGTPRGTSA